MSSDIETSVFGVATDVPGQLHECLRLTSVPAYSFTGLSIVMLTYKKSSLLLELFLVKS